MIILEQFIDLVYLKYEVINCFYVLFNVLVDEYVGNEEFFLFKIVFFFLLVDVEYLEDFFIFVKEIFEKFIYFFVNVIKDNFDILILIYEFVQENYEKEINL